MVSICLIYSTDRLSQLKQTLAYLSTVSEFNAADKILVVDGETNYHPPGFNVVGVARTDALFCRALLFEAGIAAAINDTVIIMDCDRLPHRDFFKRVVKESEFVYCTYLYQMLDDTPTATLLRLLDESLDHSLMKPDFRVTIANGTIRAAKTPMSGCMAFKKATYYAVGGVSRAYRGWGFNDTDFYLTAYFANCIFVPLELPELHLYHDYPISKRLLVAMNLWNGIRFYDKWLLPVHQDIVGVAADFEMSLDFIRSFKLDDFIKYVESHE